MRWINEIVERKKKNRLVHVLRNVTTGAGRIRWRRRKESKQKRGVSRRWLQYFKICRCRKRIYTTELNVVSGSRNYFFRVRKEWNMTPDSKKGRSLDIVSQSVQLFSHVRLFVIPWTAAHQVSLSITNFCSLLKLKSIESVMPSNHLFLCRPLLRNWMMLRRSLGQGLGRRNLARRGKLMSQRCGIKRINQNRDWPWMREVMAIEIGRQHLYR